MTDLKNIISLLDVLLFYCALFSFACLLTHSLGFTGFLKSENCCLLSSGQWLPVSFSNVLSHKFLSAQLLEFVGRNMISLDMCTTLIFAYFPFFLYMIPPEFFLQVLLFTIFSWNWLFYLTKILTKIIFYIEF